MPRHMLLAEQLQGYSMFIDQQWRMSPLEHVKLLTAGQEILFVKAESVVILLTPDSAGTSCVQDQ